MIYTYKIIQNERGPVAHIYADSVEVNACGPFEKEADAEAEAWAVAMVAGLTNGSIVLPTEEKSTAAESVRKKLASLGLTESEIAALVK